MDEQKTTFVFVGYKAGNPASLSEVMAACRNQIEKFGSARVIVLPSSSRICVLNGVCRVMSDEPFHELEGFEQFDVEKDIQPHVVVSEKYIGC